MGARRTVLGLLMAAAVGLSLGVALDSQTLGIAIGVAVGLALAGAGSTGKSER